MRTCVALLCAVVAVSLARGELVVGYDVNAAPNATQCWRGEPEGPYTPLYGGTSVDVSGLGADIASQTLHIAAGRDYYTLDLANPSTPVAVGQFHDDAGNSLYMHGLAWGPGGLYGVGGERFYRIAPDGEGTLLLTASQYTFDALAYNPVDHWFFGANNSAQVPGGPGVYRIALLGNGAIVHFANYPIGTAFYADGLAITDDDKAYLVRSNGASEIYPLDLDNGHYGASLPAPFETSSGDAGAVWIPEPCTFSILAVGALLALRRR